MHAWTNWHYGSEEDSSKERFRPLMRVSDLRAARWSSLPDDPGVYWWYFPESALEQFQIAKWCNPASLRLRWSEDRRVCLYHGAATSLCQRIEWHAAQTLR